MRFDAIATVTTNNAVVCHMAQFCVVKCTEIAWFRMLVGTESPVKSVHLYWIT